jgi:hypothetical protein
MRPQLPSLGEAVTAARRTLWRFPTVMLAAAAATVAMILQIDEVGPEALRLRLLATATLALPLLVALTLYAEGPGRRRVVVFGLRLAGALALVAFYLGWANWPDPLRAGAYWQLSVAFHLLVAFLPLVGRKLPNAFWQYNRALFLRFIAAAASSGTLFVGLALALLAVNKLFGVDVPGEGYPRLWAVMAFVFNTWFFLGGVPEDLDALEERRDYPAPLRVFAQYTLVPLVSVYLVILTLYLGKVVVTWAWPTGWIGWLVSGVAGAGILALLLVHPLVDDPGQRWIATFARVFWRAILPSIVMLWLAVYQRVQQYGITENRYTLIVLSLWLAALAPYYAVTRSRNIRLIPVSLCLVALLTLVGPWSAGPVSQASQVRRLRGLLERNGVLVQGQVRRAGREVPIADAQEISAVMRYLVTLHGTGAIRPWFSDSLARVAEVGGAPRDADYVEAWAARAVRSLGVRYVSSSEMQAPQGRFAFTAAAGPAIGVTDYDFLLSVASGSAADTGLIARGDTAARVVRVVRGAQTLVELPLDSMIARLRAASPRSVRTVPAAMLSATAENERVRATLWLRNVSGFDRGDSAVVTRIAGDVLVKLKP